MAGARLTKDQIDDVIGDALRNVNVSFDRVGELQNWLDSKTDGDLTTLGYNGTEIANLRSAFSDIGQLRDIFVGAANLTVAKDFRTFAKRLWGLGI